MNVCLGHHEKTSSFKLLNSTTKQAIEISLFSHDQYQYSDGPSNSQHEPRCYDADVASYAGR
jgi:hypothetical protein